MKNLLAFAALIALPLAVPGTAVAADIDITAQNPVIELSVTEQVTSEPDIVNFSVGVQTLASTATAAMRENAMKARAMIDRLKSLGVAERDIQTSGLRLVGQYDYEENSRIQRITGYIAQNQVQVKLRDIDKVGRILDTLVSDGATEIYGPWFAREDDSAIKAEARRRALETARKQAEEYARLNGYAGVRLLAVSETLFNSGPQGAVEFTGSRIAARDVSTPVQGGEVGTSVSISVQYEMTR